MVFNQEKYDELQKFAKSYIESKEYKKSEHRKVILKKASELGLTLQDLENAPKKRDMDSKIVNRIMSDPNILDYDKRIYQNSLDGIKPRGCYSHQYPYYPPIGTEGYDRFKNWTDCGDHCICVDKGAPKESLDILNMNKNINIGWICDGEHNERDPENIEIGQQQPNYRASTTITYKGKNRAKLDSTLKSMCSNSRIFEHSSGRDVCSIQKTKENTFSISSKIRSNRDWWMNTANTLDGLLDVAPIGSSRPSLQSRPQSQKLKPKKSSFDFGGGFQL